MRAGTLEEILLGGSPAAMSSVALPCSTSFSVPKCNNDVICIKKMFLMLLCCYDVIFC